MLPKIFHQLLSEVFGYYPPDKAFLVSDFLPEDVPSSDVLRNAAVQDPQAPYGDSPNRSKIEYVTWLKRKTKNASINIINLMEKTGSSPGLNVVRYQLIKSSTSTAANYRAACRARSANEFFAKMCIVVEEADESQFWLEILEESDIKIDKQEVRKQHQDWTEIVKIVTSAKSKAAAKKKY